MQASAHCALSRDARIGLPATVTFTGLVCSCGNSRSATQLLRSMGTRKLEGVFVSVRGHFAGRYRSTVDDDFDEPLTALIDADRWPAPRA